MKYLLKLAMIAAMLMMIATSCQKDGTDSLGAVEDDETIVQELAKSDEEELLYDAAIDDIDEARMFDGYNSFSNGMGKIAAPIDTVLRFGRRFDPHPRRVVREVRRIGEDSIFVSVSRVFQGVFVIFEKGEDSTGTRPIIIHRKRMRHAVKRNAIYVRNRDTRADVTTDLAPHHRWQLAAVSMAAGHSVPESSIRIHEVNITSTGGVDMTLTHPLDTFFDSRDDLPTFVPGEEVKVVVKLTNTTLNPVDPVGNGSTETLLLHFGANRHHHARKRFEYVGTDPATGDQIYQGTWVVRQRPGHTYHAVFDAIDNGTIYDSDATTFPYNSTTWGIPYRVVEAK